MRVPLNWLREYCDPDLDTAGIEERLTMTGTKVETIAHHGVPSAERFVVGQVLTAEAHPQADRLRVCSVDVGGAAPVEIVCGAPNVAAGQTVGVALPGAVMPDGTPIKAAKLRGIPSNGMILSEDELQIGSDHAGIMALDELVPDVDLEPGTSLADVLSISTDVLELEVTPNRPDCLGVYGVARELHAATGAPLADQPWSRDLGSDGPVEHVQVVVECSDLCRRFTARAFEGVTVATSPPWLKARLSAAGQRPINNVVDITNYVMLLTGQPLHAFDLDRVAGGRLTVRRAHEDEQVETLDGQTRTLDGEMVVIEDDLGPTSIAGVMGGARSEVERDTTRVLMEVANWSGPNIHRTSWALGLRSEASSRFEKDLAPEQCLHAQALVTRLMVELCNARILPGTIDIAVEQPPPPTIRLRERRVGAILGMDVPRARQAEILGALGFGTADADDGLDVTAPPERRNDVTREADLIEEVARINGLAELPATLPARRGAYGRLSERQRVRRRAEDALVGCGLCQVVGWTFTSRAVLDELRLSQGDERYARAVELENPLSEDQSLLRTTLLGSLREIAVYNAARDAFDLRLFEVGTVFLSGEPLPDERHMLGVLLAGGVLPATWRTPNPPRADLYAAKGVLEALAAALRVTVECTQPEGEPQPFLHPGRSADVICGGEPIGWLGELHPHVLGGHLAGSVAMELDFDALIDAARAQATERAYVDLISVPELRRDLAVVVPIGLPADEVRKAVLHAENVARPLLEDVRIFDVYTGPQVGEGRRSLALALTFRAHDRTLSDADVEPALTKIAERLKELGGELRG